MATAPKIQVTRSARINTPKARASYPHVFKATQFQGDGDPKYSLTMLVPKAEKEFMGKLRVLQDAAIKELYPKNPPVNFERWGVADGDAPDDDGNVDETTAGQWIIKASNKSKPMAVDASGGQILDELEIYGGCYVRASINAKAYGTNAKGGVTFELNVVQKVGDGEPFGGAAKAMKAAAEELGAYQEEGASGDAW